MLLCNNSSWCPTSTPPYQYILQSEENNTVDLSADETCMLCHFVFYRVLMLFVRAEIMIRMITIVATVIGIVSTDQEMFPRSRDWLGLTDACDTPIISVPKLRYKAHKIMFVMRFASCASLFLRRFACTKTPHISCLVPRRPGKWNSSTTLFSTVVRYLHLLCQIWNCSCMMCSSGRWQWSSCWTAVNVSAKQPFLHLAQVGMVLQSLIRNASGKHRMWMFDLED